MADKPRKKLGRTTAWVIRGPDAVLYLESLSHTRLSCIETWARSRPWEHWRQMGYSVVRVTITEVRSK